MNFTTLITRTSLLRKVCNLIEDYTQEEGCSTMYALFYQSALLKHFDLELILVPGDVEKETSSIEVTPEGLTVMWLTCNNGKRAYGIYCDYDELHYIIPHAGNNFNEETSTFLPQNESYQLDWKAIRNELKRFTYSGSKKVELSLLFDLADNYEVGKLPKVKKPVEEEEGDEPVQIVQPTVSSAPPVAPTPIPVPPVSVPASPAPSNAPSGGTLVLKAGPNGSFSVTPTVNGVPVAPAVNIEEEEDVWVKDKTPEEVKPLPVFDSTNKFHLTGSLWEIEGVDFVDLMDKGFINISNKNRSNLWAYIGDAQDAFVKLTQTNAFPDYGKMKQSIVRVK